MTDTKKELIETLEGYRDIIVNPDEYTIKELKKKIQHHKENVCEECGTQYRHKNSKQACEKYHRIQKM